MATLDPKKWGHLGERYAAERPRRMLALDGGGIRGLMTVKALVKLEALLAERFGEGNSRYTLCDYFDYVGGTSTGAIIAAAIARGMPAEEILEFYREFGKEAFTKRNIFLRWRSLYADGNLERKLKQVFGANTRLFPGDLQTLLLVVTRNKTTDSAWPISSNPDAFFNDPGSSQCNLNFPLYQIVRASTAAPVYFPPEVIQVDKSGEKYVFVDGGTTPYNNPAFLMYRMSTEPAYRLNWPSGEQNLLIVSLGTGTAPVLADSADDPETNLAAAAVNTLSAVMAQAQVDQDMNCRTVGRCNFGGVLDMEVADLIPRDAGGKRIPLDRDLGRRFLYLRYDAEFTREGLDRIGLHDIDPEKVGKLDSIDGMPDLERIGEKVGAMIDLEDFGEFATR
ncbi:MAG: patatin-like phospholipase family protein [Pseudomonadota bacterium]